MSEPAVEELSASDWPAEGLRLPDHDLKIKMQH